MQGLSLGNRRINVHDVAGILEISFMSVQSSLNILGLTPDLYPDCWVGSRRRIVSACGETSKQDLKETHYFSCVWSQVRMMRRGFVGLTQKPSNGCLRRTVHHVVVPLPLFKKKGGVGDLCVCSNVTSLMVSFHLGVCWICSTSTNSKPVLIHWYHVMCGEMCDENDLKSAVQEIGFSTMSMHLFTLLCLSLPFCLIKKWLLLLALYIHLT
jgi:hypothetical protein